MRDGSSSTRKRTEFRSGKPKLKADSDKALEWLLIAANQGHQLAQWQLAHCFEGGKAVKRDIVEAYKWNKLLANKGQMLTQQSMDRFVLGMTHEQTPSHG